MDAARPKIGALVQERLVVEDFDRQKIIISSIHDTSHMNRTTDMVLNITLKQSPYYMLFLQQMRLPINAEILAQSSTTDDREDNSFEETVGVLLGSRGQAFQKAQANITKAQKQQKEMYDRKHLQKELEVGTKVLFENTAQQQRKGGKMSWSMNSKI